jgi:hypothetical protein
MPQGSLQSGFFLQFFAMEHLGEKIIKHHLYQSKGVVYSDCPTKGDHVAASELDDEMVHMLSIAKRPVWKQEDAQWPTVGERPMFFVGQCFLSKNKVTQKYLTWDMNI